MSPCPGEPAQGPEDTASLQGPGRRPGRAANARPRAARRPPPQARAGPGSGSPGRHPGGWKDVAPLSDLGSREWRGRGGTGSFRGREHRRRDAHPGPVSVGLSPWLTASVRTVFRPGPRAWGRPTPRHGAGHVCARHRLRVSPSARALPRPHVTVTVGAVPPGSPSSVVTSPPRRPPALRSHEAACDSRFSLLNFHLIHSAVSVELPSSDFSLRTSLNCV